MSESPSPTFLGRFHSFHILSFPTFALGCELKLKKKIPPEHYDLRIAMACVVTHCACLAGLGYVTECPFKIQNTSNQTHSRLKRPFLTPLKMHEYCPHLARPMQASCPASDAIFEMDSVSYPRNITRPIREHMIHDCNCNCNDVGRSSLSSLNH